MNETMPFPPIPAETAASEKRTPIVYFIDDSATMREVIKIAFRREKSPSLPRATPLPPCAIRADSARRRHHLSSREQARDRYHLLQDRPDIHPGLEGSFRLGPWIMHHVMLWHEHLD